MTKYARDIEGKAVKAKGSNLRVHFKNTRETAKAIKGMNLNAAKQYLQAVIDKKRCIVFRRFCGGIGRTALAKNEGSTNAQVRACSVRVVLLARPYTRFAGRLLSARVYSG
jgi:large subunit ribosomal protein L17e